MRPLTEADLAFLARDHHALPEDPADPILPADLDLDALSVVALYRRILGVVAERRGLDFERSRLLAWLEGRSLHRELGALSVMDFATRRLGMAPREVRESLTLQQDLSMLPALSQAWRTGRISSSVAALLARVVDPDTESAWLAHAEVAPVKRLELEADLHLAMLSVMDRQQYRHLTGGLPQADVPTERLLLDWQSFFGLRGSAASETSEVPEASATSRTSAMRQADEAEDVDGVDEASPFREVSSNQLSDRPNFQDVPPF